MECDKRRIESEWYCGMCGVRWDVDDPEPPVCPVERNAPETLTDRLRALVVRFREAKAPRDFCNDLEDITEEVQLLDRARRQALANARGGSGENITPFRSRGA